MELETDLPDVLGYAGELNQIWGNLIDNALDAVPDGGRVDVSARYESARVVVRIVDNGRGAAHDAGPAPFGMVVLDRRTGALLRR